jgi:hypothetical protein
MEAAAATVTEAVTAAVTAATADNNRPLQWRAASCRLFAGYASANGYSPEPNSAFIPIKTFSPPSFQRA